MWFLSPTKCPFCEMNRLNKRLDPPTIATIRASPSLFPVKNVASGMSSCDSNWSYGHCPDHTTKTTIVKLQETHWTVLAPVLSRRDQPIHQPRKICSRTDVLNNIFEIFFCGSKAEQLFYCDVAKQHPPLHPSPKLLDESLAVLAGFLRRQAIKSLSP